MPDTDMPQGAERFTGTWWLPSQPNRRPLGVLIVQTDGQLRLELDGALPTQPRRSHADEQSDYELVRGRVGIRDFTLYKCSDMGTSYQGIPPTRQTLHVQIAIDGLRATNVNDLAFDAANIEIDLLHEWARWSKAAGNPVFKPYKNDPPGRERYVYDPVPKLSMAASDLKIDLVSGVFVGGPVGHLKMDTWQIFDVELAQPLALEEWHDRILRPLQNFVSFVSDQAAWINKVTAARLVGPSGRRYPAPVTIYGYWAKEDKERIGNLTPSSFLVSFDDVVPVFERVLSNWLRLSRHFKDALTLFFGPRYADRMYVELSFLMLAQALEVFHRTKYPGNDRIFKDRIVDLVAYAGPAVTKLVGQPPDVWANHVKNTRNDLTHWNLVRKGIEPDTQDFLDMQRQARIVMKTVLLQELGFSTSECARILAGNREYRHARGPWWDVS